MSDKDYYKALNIKKEATKEEIKRAYRKLARKFHPDINKDGDAQSSFTEISEAYEVLKDDLKRQEYDTIQSFDQNKKTSHSDPNWANQFGKDSSKFRSTSPHSFNEFNNSLFGEEVDQFSSDDIFSFIHGHQGRGQDLNANITISLEDSYTGRELMFTINKTVIDNDGHQSHQPKSFSVNIPKGVVEGQQIRLEGQGESGFGQGIPGNLFLEVSFEPHRFFTVLKRDVFIILPVTPWEAALGAKIAVPTLGGKVDINLPPNSQTGKKLRLKGRGLSSKTQQGHQYVTLAIYTPAAETEKQKQLYKKMSQLMPHNPRSGFGG